MPIFIFYFSSLSKLAILFTLTPAPLPPTGIFDHPVGEGYLLFVFLAPVSGERTKVRGIYHVYSLTSPCPLYPTGIFD